MDFTGERFIPDTHLDGELEIEHYLRYLAIAELARGKVVLDAASGEGYGSDILAREAKQVVGLEIDPLAVAQATAKYRHPNLIYIQGTIGALPLPEASVDLVVSFETIEHVAGALQEAFLREIKRVLKPGGALIISTPDKRIYSDLPQYQNEFHIKEFYREEFHDFLSQRFKHVQFWEQVAVLAYLLVSSRQGALHRIMPGEELQGKYIVAYCSDGALPDNFQGSIALDRENLYQRKVARVVELQGEIDEKNRHLFACEDAIHEIDRNVKAHEQQALELQGEINSLHQNLEECHAQAARDIEALQSAKAAVDSELGRIKSTMGWRLLRQLYRLKDRICR